MKKVKQPKQSQILSRDFNIQKCSTGELNLGTKTIKDKTKYTRKHKHKQKLI